MISNHAYRGRRDVLLTNTCQFLAQILNITLLPRSIFSVRIIFFAQILTFLPFSAMAEECKAPSTFGQMAVDTLGSYFSDVMAAPNGTPITVFGTDLSGPLVVGGIALNSCPFIDETVFTNSEAGVRLGKTTCWLTDIPVGDTTIAAGPGAPLPFRVIDGSVEIVSTFESFKQAMDSPQPGQVFLLKEFEANLSRDGRTNGGQHILYMRNGEHDATNLNPIALIGYPGAPAKFVVDGVANGNRAISLSNNGWTVSNLDFDTHWQTISANGKARIIGNRITGLTGRQRPAGTGTVVAGGDARGGVIAGNIITGGRTNWRFDHALYVTQCPSEKGWILEWNHIFDNDFARGPQVVVNHQPPRCGRGEANKSVSSHIIRNNVVDTTRYRGRCIGVSSFGWLKEYNPVVPGKVYITHNVLVNCGFIGEDVDRFNDARRGAAIYSAPGNTIIKRNTLYRPNGAISIGTTGTRARSGDFMDTSISDNIFIDRDGYDIQLSLHELSLPLVSIQRNEDR